MFNETQQLSRRLLICALIWTRLGECSLMNNKIKLLRAMGWVFSVLLICGPAAQADPIFDKREVSTALDRIDQAVKFNEQLGQSTISSLQGQARRDAQYESTRLLNEGSRRVSEMRRSYISDGNGNKVPLYTADQIRQAEESYKERAQAALLRGESNAAATNDLYNQRQRALSESARNLQSQLITRPTAADSVVLAPQGTNLYVRNYQIIGEQYAKLPHVEPVTAVPNRGTYISPNRAAVGVMPARNEQAPTNNPSASGIRVTGDVRTSVKGQILH
jgi:hypothetical protein